MTKIVVTGGCGYIGSHAVIELIEGGMKPIVLDDLSRSNKEAIRTIEKLTGQKIEIHQIDLKERQAVLDFFSTQKDIAGVIHFAAFKSVEESLYQPLEYYRNNVSGMINLLDAFKQNDIKNIVFSSSCTVYGQPEKLPVDENLSFKSTPSVYGHTKQICEDILKRIVHLEKFNAISLRYFNPGGAHISTQFGEDAKHQSSNLIPVITEVSVGMRRELKIFGDDYETPDGTCIRDYVHVSDLARVHVDALEKLIKQKSEGYWNAYNLGSGNGYSVLEVVNTFQEVTGRKIPYTITKRRKGDVAAIYADCSKAKLELNYRPQHSLADILTTAWEWEKKRSAGRSIAQG